MLGSDNIKKGNGKGCIRGNVKNSGKGGKFITPKVKHHGQH